MTESAMGHEQASESNSVSVALCQYETRVVRMAIEQRKLKLTLSEYFCMSQDKLIDQRSVFQKIGNPNHSSSPLSQTKKGSTESP